MGDIQLVGRPANDICHRGFVLPGNGVKGIVLFPLVINAVRGGNDQLPAGTEESGIVVEQVIICPKDGLRFDIVFLGDGKMESPG